MSTLGIEAWIWALLPESISPPSSSSSPPVARHIRPQRFPTSRSYLCVAFSDFRAMKWVSPYPPLIVCFPLQQTPPCFSFDIGSTFFLFPLSFLDPCFNEGLTPATGKPFCCPSSADLDLPVITGLDFAHRAFFLGIRFLFPQGA